MKNKKKRRKKSRICVRGNFSSYYDSVYTSTLDCGLARTVLRLAEGKKWALGSADVRTAFLHAPIPDDRVVFVRPPKVLIDLGLRDENEMWRLNRALYGLRESPRYWGLERDLLLRDLRFSKNGENYSILQSEVDPCLWHIKSDKSPECKAVLTTYVDDLLVIGEFEIIQEVIKAIRSLWKTTEPEYLLPNEHGVMRFLGIEIERTPGYMFIHQTRYIHDLLQRFDFSKCKPSYALGPDFSTKNENVSQLSENSVEKIYENCQSCLGGLVWLSTRTRVDIAFAVSRAAQALSVDPVRCWSMCKKILRYLSAHATLGLKMFPFDDPNSVPPLESYSDASFAPEEDTRSHEGCVVTWGGVPLIWRTKRQAMVATSTAESELISSATVLNYCLGFANVLETIKFGVDSNIIYCDNKAAIANVVDQTSTWRSRHYLLRAAAIRDYSSKGLILIKYVDSANQLADFLTKYLSRVLFERNRKMLGIVEK